MKIENILFPGLNLPPLRRELYRFTLCLGIFISFTVLLYWGVDRVTGELTPWCEYVLPLFTSLKMLNVIIFWLTPAFLFGIIKATLLSVMRQFKNHFCVIATIITGTLYCVAGMLFCIGIHVQRIELDGFVRLYQLGGVYLFLGLCLFYGFQTLIHESPFPKDWK